jgi:hypothetical protein
MVRPAINETFGRIHFWTTFIGANLTFFPSRLEPRGFDRRLYRVRLDAVLSLRLVSHTACRQAPLQTPGGVMVTEIHPICVLRGGDQACFASMTGRQIARVRVKSSCNLSPSPQRPKP